MEYPKHLERHKLIYELHAGGKKYTDIAKEMNVTPTTIRNLAKRWERELKRPSGTPSIQIELADKYASVEIGDLDELSAKWKGENDHLYLEKFMAHVAFLDAFSKMALQDMRQLLADYKLERKKMK